MKCAVSPNTRLKCEGDRPAGESLEELIRPPQAPTPHQNLIVPGAASLGQVSRKGG